MKSEQEGTPVEGNSRRPVFLTVLCLFSFVFFAVIAILFLVSAFFSGWITEAIHVYTPEHLSSRFTVILIAVAGFLLHAAAFTGTFLMWRMKRSGYILFCISILVITVYLLFQGHISFLSTLVYVLMIFLFGIFLKKLA